jgi:hypothetical protein
MNTKIQGRVFGWSLVLLLVIGCQTANVNPRVAQSHTGYVDLYCPGDMNVSWDVKHFQSKSSKAKTLFSDVMPLNRPVLRLALRPGHHRLEITFLNKAVLAPDVVDVLVQAGKITPVQVALHEQGEITTRSQEYELRPTVQGVGRAREVRTSLVTFYEISATVEQPIPYRPKEALAYAK